MFEDKRVILLDGDHIPYDCENEMDFAEEVKVLLCEEGIGMTIVDENDDYRFCVIDTNSPNWQGSEEDKVYWKPAISKVMEYLIKRIQNDEVVDLRVAQAIMNDNIDHDYSFGNGNGGDISSYCAFNS